MPPPLTLDSLLPTQGYLNSVPASATFWALISIADDLSQDLPNPGFEALPRKTFNEHKKLSRLCPERIRSWESRPQGPGELENQLLLASVLHTPPSPSVNFGSPSRLCG